MKKPKKLEIDISKEGIERISATVPNNPKDMADAIGILSDIMLKDILREKRIKNKTEEK